MSTVVIVESPAKAKTINKFLGPDFLVLASYGHVRDLPSKDGSVDPERDFAMQYQIPKSSAKHVETLAKAVKACDTVLLATDPDREGEAISWHVLDILKERRVLQEKTVKRVVFHEITRRAIEEAIAHARDLDMNLVNAQQARRALDYLVGFNLSPLLWKKVRRGLSAGRVQSVALRFICEREDEITSFVPREYWSIEAEALKAGAGAKSPIIARLAVADGKKLGKFDIPDETEATRLVEALAGKDLFVAELEKKQLRRRPPPPFITSTLQQEAFRKLGFSTKKTMMLAQRLYEGMEIPTADGGLEVAGLITYMRTDSVNLADEAIGALRGVIGERYGKEYLPKEPNRFKSSAKNAQEAHEAIRPTNPAQLPDALKATLERDLVRLYELIWKRAVACQMAVAKIDQVAAVLSVGEDDVNAPFRLRATGSSIAFPGFMKVYSEGRDEVSAQDREDDGDERMLPPLETGEKLRQKSLKPIQHFTEPLPRFTEASLVKTLESYGIGRPSTYAPIMTTLQERGYVRLEQKKFCPEDVGMVVNKYLVEHFSQYVDYNFTARLEDGLDSVSRGEKPWIPLMKDFWTPFIGRVHEKEATTKKSDVTTEETEEECPKCGAKVMIRLGRFGRFKACSGYPECRFTENIAKEGEEKPAQPEVVLSDQLCDKCNKPMQIKDGRYGKYLACSSYPDCKNIQPLEKPKDTGVACPLCGKGVFLEKKSRRGKIFYSCSVYPKCKNALWNLPVKRPCPKCNAPFVTEKITKRWGTQHICVGEGCDYKEQVASAGEEEA